MNSIAALWCRFHLLNTQLAVYTFFVARILQSFAALVKPRQKVSFVHLFLFCFLQNLNVSCRKAYRDKKKVALPMKFAKWILRYKLLWL